VRRDREIAIRVCISGNIGRYILTKIKRKWRNIKNFLNMLKKYSSPKIMLLGHKFSWKKIRKKIKKKRKILMIIKITKITKLTKIKMQRIKIIKIKMLNLRKIIIKN
jgi:hypothetical protein